ncbi:PspC domain-containing protein [Lactococcus muris]|uniref:PspC domain-containing protein n=1 Tax=Lactococcus muris TaxID=2941330 RepID=A0ABV4DBD0_9LACT|nr:MULTISPECIES: PspC domain-containing protein [Lactococcus]MBL3717007.1 PspC domain-containing protein [Lactococcus garvieae]
MTQKKLTKSLDNRMLTGTIAGLGEYFGLDRDKITLMRILYVLFALGSLGTLVFVYIIASWIIPSSYQ